MTTRRIGSEDSATRTALLDAAQRLMVDEGYAAVTSRRLAAEAGLKPQLVHYYFRTMDDLFIAVVRRGAEQNLERQAKALASAQPLRALWAFTSDIAGGRLTTELTALANHRKELRSEWVAYAEQFRRLQVAALTTILERYGAGDDVPPEVMSVMLTGIGQVLVIEEAMGVTAGHDATRAAVERWLSQWEPLG